MTGWHWAHESYFVLRLLTVLAKRQSILQRQINLLEVLTDNVLTAAAWSVARLPPVCKQRVELVDDSGKRGRRMWPSQRTQHWVMVKKIFDWPVLRPGSSLNIRTDLMHPLDDPEGAVLETTEVEGEGFVEKQAVKRAVRIIFRFIFHITIE